MPLDLLRLSETHRRTQERIADALARVLLAQYARTVAVGYTNDTLVEEWLSVMVPLIRVSRERSTAVAGSFYRQAAGLAGRPPQLYEADPLPNEAIRTSLRVTGVIGIVEKIEAGKSLERAIIEAGSAAAGAADRHVLNGGRSLIRNSIARDPNVLGYYRQTRDGCCSFCAVLASRGPVYKADSFADSDPRFIGNDSDVKVHDHCHCQIVQVYGRDQVMPAINRDFERLWTSSTKGFSGNDALNAFRRAYEAKFAHP
jgi:hypothetical protein